MPAKKKMKQYLAVKSKKEAMEAVAAYKTFQAVQLKDQPFCRENSSLMPVPEGYVCSNWTIKAKNRAEAKKILAKLWDSVESGKKKLQAELDLAEADRVHASILEEMQKPEATPEMAHDLNQCEATTVIGYTVQPSSWERFKKMVGI